MRLREVGSFSTEISVHLRLYPVQILKTCILKELLLDLPTQEKLWRPRLY